MSFAFMVNVSMLGIYKNEAAEECVFLFNPLVGWIGLEGIRSFSAVQSVLYQLIPGTELLVKVSSR